jgi:hypothetical protein
MKITPLIAELTCRHFLTDLSLSLGQPVIIAELAFHHRWVDLSPSPG